MNAASEQQSDSSDRVLQIDRREDVVVLTPKGDLGEFVASELDIETRELLQQLTGDSSWRHIVVDFCHTDYFGSSALGLFVRIWKLVQDRGGRMAMCNLSVHEVEVLKITRLAEFWVIAESLNRALEAVHQADAS